MLVMCAGRFEYPGYLTRNWFEEGNAFNLRLHVRDIALRLLAGQARDRNSSSLSEALVDIDEYEKRSGDK